MSSCSSKSWNQKKTILNIRYIDTYRLYEPRDLNVPQEDTDLDPTNSQRFNINKYMQKFINTFESSKSHKIFYK